MGIDLYTIMVKDLAAQFRAKYHDLRIEGHPANSFQTQRHQPSGLTIIHPARPAFILIKDKSKNMVKLSLTDAKPMPWNKGIVAGTMLAVAKLACRGNFIKKPQYIFLDLNDTSSIQRLENWINTLIMGMGTDQCGTNKAN